MAVVESEDVINRPDINIPLYEALLAYGQRYADWYIGAKRVLTDKDNPARVSQSAQSVREIIEKLPRDSHTLFTKDGTGMRQLKTELDRAFSQSKKNPADFMEYYKSWSERVESYYPTRRDHRKKLRVTRTDPSAILPLDVEEEHLKRWSDFDKGFIGYAHNKTTDVDEQAYATFLKEFEDFLLAQLAPDVTEDFRTLQEQVTKFEAGEKLNIDAIVAIAKKNSANYRKFFSIISSPKWFDYLEKLGLLTNPPDIVETNERIYFPHWAAHEYLKKLCAAHPDKVALVIKQLPDVKNPIVHELIVDLVASLPTESFALIKADVRSWLRNQYARVADHKLIELAKLYLQAGDTPESRELLRILLELRDEQLGDLEKARAYIDDYYYGRVLDEVAEPLYEYDKLYIIGLLVDLLVTAFELQREDMVGKDTGIYIEDLSDIWRPKLSSAQYGDKILDLLITKIMFLVKQEGLSVGEAKQVVDSLIGKRYKLFVRMAVAILRVKKYEELASAYGEYVSAIGDPSDNFEPRSGFIEYESPLSVEDMESMSDEVLLTFLYEWKPAARDVLSFKEESVHEELRNFSKQSPRRTIGLLHVIDDAYPEYLWDLLFGLVLASQNKELKACGPDLLSELTTLLIRLKKYINNEDYGAVFSAVADLYSNLADTDAVSLDDGSLKEAHIAIKKLMKSKDPTPEREEKYRNSSRDTFSLSVNSTRPKAILASIACLKNYVRSQNYKPESKSILIASILKDLQPFLMLDKESSYAVRAALVHEFPFLAYVGDEWTEQNLDNFFPTDKATRTYFMDGMHAYIRTSGPYKESFLLIKKKLVQFLAKLESAREVLDETDKNRLVVFVFSAYLHGWIGFDDDLMVQFQKLDGSYLGDAVDFVGRQYKNESFTKNAKAEKRARAYWEHRKKTGNVKGEEYSHWPLWFRYSDINLEWSVENMLLAVKSTDVQYLYMASERIHKLAATMPLEASQLLYAILNRQSTTNLHHITYEPNFKSALEKIAKSQSEEARELAGKCINRLLVLGYADFDGIMTGS